MNFQGAQVGFGIQSEDFVIFPLTHTAPAEPSILLLPAWPLPEVLIIMV